MIVGLLFIAIIWCLRGFLSYEQQIVPAMAEHSQWYYTQTRLQH